MARLESRTKLNRRKFLAGVAIAGAAGTRRHNQLPRPRPRR